MARRAFLVGILCALILPAAAARSAMPEPAASTLTLLCATPRKDGINVTVAGIVNTYQRGSGSPNAGDTSITLGTYNTSGNTQQVEAGDLLFIIQMQDADIDSTNTDAYGDAVAGAPARGSTAVNSAGLYEYVEVTSVSPGSSLPLTGGTVNISGAGSGGGLLNSYRTEAATASQGRRTWQIVRVPQYGNATLDPGTPPRAAAWDGFSGGVFVMDVADTLDWNGTNISANGVGFRGAGARIPSAAGTGATTDYRNSLSANSHALKGEGIAGTPRYVYRSSSNSIVDNGAEGYPDGDMARGAPGTAGGGGTDASPSDNTLNTGGGGGGNGSTGGQGGMAPDSSDLGGFGGAAFPSTPARITFGGGGGAGSRNNSGLSSVRSSGAAGGGIIHIRAHSISGTGTVNANGANAIDVNGADGGGGGGAGGSVVIVSLAGPVGTLTVNARGGAGGDADPGGTLTGPGGGGGGGAVFLSAATTIDVSGGPNGVTGGGNVAHGATSGAPGTSDTSVTPDEIPGIRSGSSCTSVSVSNASVTEGNSGTANMTFTITNPTGGSITVDYHTVDGSATAGEDYVAVPAGQVTFSGASTTINVVVNGDTTVEGDETFTLVLDTTSAGRLGYANGIGTILNDDTGVSVQWTAASQSAAEGALVTVTATLTATTGQDVTVSYSLGGTATPTSDFDAPTPDPLVINSGNLTADVTFTVANDALFEVSETVVLTITGATNATPAGTLVHTVTIDPDSSVLAPEVQWTAASQTRLEGDLVTVTATLSTASGASTTVFFSVGGTATSTADFDAPTPDPLVIPAGDLTASVTFTVVDDAFFEVAETVILTITGATNATPSGTLVHTVTIDPDPADSTVEVRWSIASQTVAEGALVTVTATLSAATGTDVTINYSVGGTAATPADFSAPTPASGALTIAMGNTTADVTFTVADDGLFEVAETVVLTITGATNATPAGILVHTVTIDQDPADAEPTVAWTTVAQNVVEGTLVTVTATLSAISGADTTVFYTAGGTATPTADYSAPAPDPLVITAGNLTASLTFTTANDALFETAESVILTITGATNATPSGTLIHTVTIDPDASDAEPTVAWTTAAQSVAEGALVTVTATLSAISGADTTVVYTVGGTATPGTDFTAPTPSPLVIPAGSLTASVTFTVLADGVQEGAQTVQLNIASATNATPAGILAHVVTIAGRIVGSLPAGYCGLLGLELLVLLGLGRILHSRWPTRRS